MRARIDVSEIEAQTKIRAKYLRALENEEWGLLPGPTFVKSFLRTYAQALDLDAKGLVEEYRLHHERPSESMLEPIVSTPRGPRRRSQPTGPSRGYVFAVGGIVLVIVVLIVLLATGGGSSSKSPSKQQASSGKPKHKPHRATTGSGLPSQYVALSLEATGEDYVCLVDDKGRKRLSGVTLQAGERTSTYHANRFEIRLGNSDVKMIVDGTPRTVPASSEPIGYTVTKAHGRQPLAAAQLPTC
jgi:hypothetical protein